ncbi:MAG TPA: BRO family protein [Gemmataceae bacterium]|nr:BRO family protein [Gemmataceae bacterium]
MAIVNLPNRQGWSPFDALRHEESDGTEWWSARELMEPFGYERWENMEKVVRKAESNCRSSGYEISDHFRDITKVRPNGGTPSRDVQVSRFGAYLIALNGDADKPQIAAAKRYFAVQTRRAELHLSPPSQSVPAPEQLIARAWSERLSETVQWLRLYLQQHFPYGSFTTYTATGVEILMIEDELMKHHLPLQYGDLPDGSIGKCWANYRKEVNLPEPIGTALLDMPHLEIIVEVLVYGADLRPAFDEWLNTVYIPKKMPEYFKNKKSYKLVKLSAASAADQASRRLTGKPASLPPETRLALEAAGGIVLADQQPKQLPPPSNDN